MISALVFVSLIACVSAFSFSRQNIISPIEGEFANRQPLVISKSPDQDIYFSLTGSDPLYSGFAYDGPVLIDMTGNIDLKITAVSQNGSTESYEIKYSVKTDALSEYSPEQAEFLRKISERPVQRLVPGESFSFPSGIGVALNDDGFFHDPSTLFLNQDNPVDRYLPVTVKGNRDYRFLIHTVAYTQSIPVNKEPVYRCPEWNQVFPFNAGVYIFQVDDEYWTDGRSGMTVDRSVSHVLRYQPLEYDPQNEVKSVLLPAKPKITVSRNLGNVLEGKITAGEKSDGLWFFMDSRGNTFRNFTIRAFPGEVLNGFLDLTLCHEGVPQGKVQIPYSIDFKQPQKPHIISDIKSGFSRNPVTVDIKTDDGTKVMYSLVGPITQMDTIMDWTQDTVDGIEFHSFVPYSGSQIVLDSRDSQATFWKLGCYSMDNSGNTSDLVTYSVLVDQYNYYLELDEEFSLPQKLLSAADKLPIEIRNQPYGSSLNPFTDLETAFEILENVEDFTLYIKGSGTVDPNYCIDLTRNCRIIGDNCHLNLSEGTEVNILDCSVRMEKIILHKNLGADSLKSRTLVNVSNGSLAIDDCELAGIFQDNGILIQAHNSKLDFRNSGLTLQTQKYGSLLSAKDCESVLVNMRQTLISPTAVAFSISGGTFEIGRSSVNVFSHSGRGAEFAGAKVSLHDNIWNGNLENQGKGIQPVWKDMFTEYVLNSGNSFNGW